MNQGVIDSFISVNSIQFGAESVVSSLGGQFQRITAVSSTTIAPTPELSSDVIDEAVALIASERESVEPEFNRLMLEWKTTRRATSSTTAIVTHPAYQRIIGLGRPALPLILRELSRELDHWFWALKAISGDDPVPPEHIGRMRQMAKDWIEWGRKHGYVR